MSWCFSVGKADSGAWWRFIGRGWNVKYFCDVVAIRGRDELCNVRKAAPRRFGIAFAADGQAHLSSQKVDSDRAAGAAKTGLRK